MNKPTCFSLTIDQHIAHRTFKAAGVITVVEREAGDAVDHFQCGIGAIGREELGLEDQGAVVICLRCGGRWCGRRCLGMGKGRERQAKANDRCGEQQTLDKHFNPLPLECGKGFEAIVV